MVAINKAGDLVVVCSDDACMDPKLRVRRARSPSPNPIWVKFRITCSDIAYWAHKRIRFSIQLYRGLSKHLLLLTMWSNQVAFEASLCLNVHHRGGRRIFSAQYGSEDPGNHK